MLRFDKKNFEDEELPPTWIISNNKTSKIQNAYANNMPTDIKLSIAQIPKKIQSGGSFASCLGI